MTDPLALLVLSIVGVLGIARAVRLVTSDSWPPIKALRDRWKVRTGQWVDGHLEPGPWTDLFTCPFCFAPYPTALALAGAIWAGLWSPDLGTLAGWWWVLAVWAAASYAAAMVVVRDEPPPVDA